MSFKYEISISIDVKDVVDGINTLMNLFDESYNWEYNPELGNNSNILIGTLLCNKPLSATKEKQICDTIKTRIKQNMPNYEFDIQCVRKHERRK